jgi:hypothetical protein
MRRLAVLATALSIGVVLAQAAPASAYDSYPCGGIFWHDGFRVQYCPDWSPNNWIPVYYDPSAGSRVVGQIYAPGSDWYYCQQRFNSIYALGPYQTDVWAFTRADNNQPGWVPEVYFSGGANYEADRTLRWC